MFSDRTAWPRDPNPISQALVAARRQGRRLLDLTNNNPSQAGLSPHPVADEIWRRISIPPYIPEPLGQTPARQAVAEYYRHMQISVTPGRVFLGSGTSELYLQLFWLFGDPGGRILVQRPGYPLFEMIAGLANLTVEGWHQIFDGNAWRIDRAGLAAQMDQAPRPRAIVLISPNNPTGNFLAPGDWFWLSAHAAERNIPLIVDEVFADYSWTAEPAVRHQIFSNTSGLTFVLSGLSKVLALPQLKLSWGVAVGARNLVDEALARLELTADTFLNTAPTVQAALPDLLAQREVLQAGIKARCRQNLDALFAKGWKNLRALPVDGGWSAVVTTARSSEEDEKLAARILEHGVIVSPGFLFDLPPELGASFVLSLLTDPGSFSAGLDMVDSVVAG